MAGVFSDFGFGNSKQTNAFGGVVVDLPEKLAAVTFLEVAELGNRLGRSLGIGGHCHAIRAAPHIRHCEQVWPEPKTLDQTLRRQRFGQHGRFVYRLIHRICRQRRTCGKRGMQNGFNSL